MNDLTHYTLAFSRPHRGGLRDTACGDVIPLAQHTNEPTCPDCKAFVEAEASDTRTAEEVFGEAPDPSLAVHSTLGDPLAGYRPKAVR